MTLTFALVLASDLIVKNPHYAACMAIEPGTWEWWLKQCWIYDPLSVVVAGGLALAAAKLVLWLSWKR